MSGKSTPTGMMKKSTRIAEPKNCVMPRVLRMAAAHSRISRSRAGRCVPLRSGLGMRTKASDPQAISAPATSSSRMSLSSAKASSSAPSAGPAMDEADSSD